MSMVIHVVTSALRRLGIPRKTEVIIHFIRKAVRGVSSLHLWREVSNSHFSLCHFNKQQALGIDKTVTSGDLRSDLDLTDYLFRSTGSLMAPPLTSDLLPSSPLGLGWVDAS